MQTRRNPYRAAVLGCGPRSDHHATAYHGLEEIQLIAACDMNRERLEEYGQRFGLERLYQDFEGMLQTEKPDVVHIVTQPQLREQPLELAAAYGVKGIIVEKPLALSPAQARQIAEIVSHSDMKVAVNTQRPYFHTSQGLKKVLDEMTIGQLGFVRCMTRGNMLSMGPHMMDLLAFFLNQAYPETVWACANGWNGEDYSHPAPANVLARFQYANGLTVYLEDAFDAIGTAGESEFWQHFELDFWGTKGRAWWLQNRHWGYQAEGMATPFSAPSIWADDEENGQREFTRALAHWLSDDSKVHVNCLENALKQFHSLMAIMSSALTGTAVRTSDPIPDDVVARLETQLKSQG